MTSLGGKDQLVTYLLCLQWLESVDLLIEEKSEITDGTYGCYPSFIEDSAITHAS